MIVRVEVRLKPSVLDPQGEAIARALGALGFDGVASVRQGKIFEIDVAAADASSAREKADEMARRLLANTVIEDFRVLEVVAS